MPLIIHSPYSGKQVKVRDQDVGRAIRDEEGRIFYVVQRASGEGVYAALTRKGSEKDEQRYDALLQKGETARAVGQERSRQQVLDATGKSRGKVRTVLILIVLVVLAAVVTGGYAIWSGIVEPKDVPLLRDVWPQDPESDTEQPAASRVYRLGLGQPVTIRLTNLPHPPDAPDTNPPADPYAAYTTTPAGLRLLTTRFTDGPTPTAGQFVRVHFATYSPNGTLLDQSRPGPPLGFVYYAGHAPQAWDLALTGLRLGEARSVLAPARLIRPTAPHPPTHPPTHSPTHSPKP
ncbi:MAG: FKBP-type peptidyl-prolyl cis-trans isomerase, partial [Planctomycetota bacterium]